MLLLDLALVELDNSALVLMDALAVDLITLGVRESYGGLIATLEHVQVVVVSDVILTAAAAAPDNLFASHGCPVVFAVA